MKKNNKIFPMRPFVRLFFVTEMFLEVTLFLETYSILKTPGCTPGRQPWLTNEGNSWVLDQLEYSLFQ